MAHNAPSYIAVGSIFAIVGSGLAHEAEAREVVRLRVEAAWGSIRADHGPAFDHLDRHDEEYVPIPPLSYTLSFATATSTVSPSIITNIRHIGAPSAPAASANSSSSAELVPVRPLKDNQ